MRSMTKTAFASISYRCIKNEQMRQSLKEREIDGIEKYSAQQIVPQMMAIYNEMLNARDNSQEE